MVCQVFFEAILVAAILRILIWSLDTGLSRRGWFMLYKFILFAHQVACMQFINIVVHSVENMNFRVHLQYEFTQHGLDDYLEASVTLYAKLTALNLS